MENHNNKHLFDEGKMSKSNRDYACINMVKKILNKKKIKR